MPAHPLYHCTAERSTCQQGSACGLHIVEFSVHCMPCSDTLDSVNSLVSFLDGKPQGLYVKGTTFSEICIMSNIQLLFRLFLGSMSDPTTLRNGALSTNPTNILFFFSNLQQPCMDARPIAPTLNNLSLLDWFFPAPCFAVQNLHTWS